jgi:hypothetical protein
VGFDDLTVLVRPRVGLRHTRNFSVERHPRARQQRRPYSSDDAPRDPASPA